MNIYDDIAKFNKRIAKAKKMDLFEEIRRRANIINGVRVSLINIAKNVKIEAGVMTPQKANQYIAAIEKLKADLSNQAFQLAYIRNKVNEMYPADETLDVESQTYYFISKTHDLMKLIGAYMVEAGKLIGGLKTLKRERGGN